MRTVLNHTILSTVLVLMASVLGLSSCQREVPTADAQSGDVLVSFTVNTPAVAETTKSVITGDYFETGIRSILILIAGEDGSYKKVYKEATSGFLSTGIGGAVLQLDGVNLKAKYQRYDIYAFVNMGDVLSSIPKDASGKLNPASFAYRLPDAYADLGTRGMPMCAQASLEANELGTGGETRVRLTLRRLMAKVVISVSKSGMTGENAGVLNSSAIRVRQVPRFICPFAAGGSRAATASDLYGGTSASTTETDYFVFSAGAGDVNHTSVTTLYVPENCQGTGAGSTQEDKAPSGGALTGRHALSTYLEYTASKVGTGDGLSGDLTYKAYLGENEINDYNVAGDKVYRAALNLSWNGLFFDGDWRVDNSDITDGRRLYLSTTANAASSFTDWGHLRRNVVSELYVNFSRDGGSTWVHSAKDIDSWPYGWDLWVDGVKQGAGASGTATGDLGWAYTGAAAGDRLGITPGPSSVSSTTHTLQVRSADGRIASNVVSFEVSQPLSMMMPYGNSYYVAQRTPVIIIPNCLEDSSATVTFTEKNGNAGIEIVQTSNTSAVINLLAEGDYTVVATASNGQTGEISLSARNPLVEKLWMTSYDLWVDGTESASMLRYTTTDGTEMTVAEFDGLGYGTKFAPSLYERVLKPRITSLSPLGSFAFSNALRNLIELNDNKMYVTTLECTTPGEEIAVKDYLMGQQFKVNVKAGVENLVFQVYFKDPFADVTNTSFSETFHDFTTMYAHISSTMKDTYGQSKNHSLGSGTGKMLYADASNVLIQAAQTIETSQTALTGTYINGSGYISIGLGAEGQYHPSGVNDVYIHVQNKYDKAAGGERAAYCLSKKIGTATIYLHVAWATIVKPRNYHGEYDIKVINSGHYKKEHPNDTWDMRFLCGGFLKNNDVEWNTEVRKLTSSDFYTTYLSDGTGFYYYMGEFTLTNPYGFVASRFVRNSADVAYGLGFAIMKTYSGNGHDTSTWSDWRTSANTSPFCRYDPTFTKWTGSGSWGGLTGYYYLSDKDNDKLKDASGNGYVVAHFLQDLPVNPNNGYVEY